MAAQPHPEILVRPLTSVDDCHACVDVQRDVWGWEQADVVPATLLHVVDYVGGLAAGAFDAGGVLLGFVFGITGVRDGEIVHWSHMLGVREQARNMGVGRMLKEYQRSVLAERGVRRIYWTFDPLMAKNAHLNINRLGAEVIDYVADMYGSTASPLHLGLATDRLVVSLCTHDTKSSWEAPHDVDLAPILTPFPRLNDTTVTLGDKRPPVTLLEVPLDILDIIARSASAARTWRLAVRDHFKWAFKAGYRVRGVHRTAGGRSFYIMVQ
jgi:predicted GNAT superfamily acetyltransferase